MLRRHPIAIAYVLALALWGSLALQLRAEPVPDFAPSLWHGTIHAAATAL